jgi:hypothetical protein
MKSKLILFATIFLFLNVAVMAQNRKHKVKNTNHANSANTSQKNNNATNGNTNFIDSTFFIKSPKANVKQPAGKARVKQGNK